MRILTGAVARSGVAINLVLQPVTGAACAAAAVGARWLGRRGIERVARGAHRADDVGPVAVVERLAQPPDMHVDGAQLELGVAAPYGVEQLLAREHAARPLEEEAQQAELGG